MDTNHIIVTKRLSRSFGSFVAVRDVSLSVPEGVVYAFLGPNGAGKTTTIRMILGLIAPTAGNVHLFGRPFQRQDWQRLDRVGTLVESPSLYLHLTGHENLEVVRRMLDLPKQNMDRVLCMMGLEKAAGRLVRQYSLGMQQRLALAIAMLNDPVLLVLDEPTNGLDPAGIQEIRTLIREIPEKTGATVFLSSHLLSEVELMATHLGIIHKGSLLFQGELSELRRHWAPVLRVTVDRATDAAALLVGQGWQAQKKENGIEVRLKDETSSLTINQVLMQNGFFVRELTLHQPGLEEMFLELTETGDSNRIM